MKKIKTVTVYSLILLASSASLAHAALRWSTRQFLNTTDGYAKLPGPFVLRTATGTAMPNGIPRSNYCLHFCQLPLKRQHANSYLSF